MCKVAFHCRGCVRRASFEPGPNGCQSDDCKIVEIKWHVLQETEYCPNPACPFCLEYSQERKNDILGKYADVMPNDTFQNAYNTDRDLPPLTVQVAHGNTPDNGANGNAPDNGADAAQAQVENALGACGFANKPLDNNYPPIPAMNSIQSPQNPVMNSIQIPQDPAMNGIQIAPSPDKNSTQGGNLLPLMNNDNPGQPQQVVVPQVPMASGYSWPPQFFQSQQFGVPQVGMAPATPVASSAKGKKKLPGTGSGSPWSANEDNILFNGRNSTEPLGYDAILEQMNTGRTRSACHTRWIHLKKARERDLLHGVN